MGTPWHANTEDVFMALPIAGLIIWCALLATVMLSPHQLDLTTGGIFFGFGALGYVLGSVIGAFSALRAIARARSAGRELSTITRILVAGIFVFVAFPWVAFPTFHALRGVG